MKTARLPFINYPEVGERLRTILIEKNISQGEIASRVKIKQGNLSRFMKSGLGISTDKVRSIAEELDIDVHELYGVQRA